MFPIRRRTAIASLAGLTIAGCVGDEFGTRDDVPHPLDDDNGNDALDESTVESILSFAEESADSLTDATVVLEEWKTDPDAVDIEEFDQLRIEATGLLNRYDSDVAPNLEEIADLDPGTEFDGTTWEADGEALAEIVPGHESLLFHLQESSVEIVDADGNPDAVPSAAHQSVDRILEETEWVVEETRDALAGNG